MKTVMSSPLPKEDQYATWFLKNNLTEYTPTYATAVYIEVLQWFKSKVEKQCLG